ncbi:MAG TPA: hypothetical protein VI981_05410 [Candidatus Paceibacterota bacterium]
MKSKRLYIYLAVIALAIVFFAVFTRKSANDVSSTIASETEEAVPKNAENFLTNEKRNILSENPLNNSETPPQSETQKTDPCASKNNDEKLSCFGTYYGTMVHTKGVKTAFDDLKARYDTDAYVKSECHQLIHLIGRAAFTKFNSVPKAFAVGDPVCWSGYYHGVMEGLGLKDGLGAFSKENVDAICFEIPGKKTYSFEYYNCVHGLGHGIMAITYNKLFDSLPFCDNLKGSWEQQSCGGGVFMENVIADSRDHKTAYLKPEDPVYPCNAVPEKHKQMCYLMQTSYMLKVNGRDFKKTFEICGTVDANYVDTCYQSLGRDASGQTTSDKDQTRSLCMLGTGERQQSNCVMGAVKDFVSYFHSDTQALEFCNSLETNLASICRDTVKSYYRTF